MSDWDFTDKFKNAKSFYWCQEEPQNQGPWFFVQPRLNQLAGKIGFFGRPAIPASAVGTGTAFKKEYETLIKSIFP